MPRSGLRGPPRWPPGPERGGGRAPFTSPGRRRRLRGPPVSSSRFGQSGTTASAWASHGPLTGLLVGALSIAAVTVAVAVLKHFVAALGLTGLYLFAVFPVASGWGVRIAGIVARGISDVLVLLRSSVA